MKKRHISRRKHKGGEPQATGTSTAAVTTTSDGVALATIKDQPSNVVGKKSSGLMSIFPLVYEIIAAISVVLLLVVVVMVLLDVVMFGFVEVVQSIKTMRNNYSLTYNESNEYRLLQYASAYLTEEPYRVYAQRNLLNLAMAVVGFAIIVLGFQLGIFMILKIRAIATGIPYDEDLKFDRIKKSLGILGTVFVGGLILLAIFKTLFTKNYQKRAQHTRANLSEIDKFVFDNLVKDAGLLSALTNHNMPLTKSIVERYARNAVQSKSYSELHKVFFTMSLFNYFDSLAPLASESRADIMTLFTIEALTKKTVVPHALFFYKVSNRVENAFDESFIPSDIPANEKQAVNNSVENLIGTLNAKLTSLKEPGKIRFRFLIFSIVYLMVALRIALFLYVMFKNYGVLPNGNKTNTT